MSAGCGTAGIFRLNHQMANDGERVVADFHFDVGKLDWENIGLW